MRLLLPKILLVAIGLSLAVYWWSRTQPVIYEAVASLIASSTQGQIGVVGGSVISPLPAGTVAQVTQSPLVLRPLIAAVRENRSLLTAERQWLVSQLERDLSSPDERREKIVSVSAEQGIGENSVYTLRTRAPSASAARVLANLASEQLLAWDTERTLREVALAQTNFTLQLAQVDRRLSLPGLSSLERQTLIYRRATMQDNLAQLAFLKTARPSSLQALVSAVDPAQPITASPLRNAALIGVLGLFLGSGMAVVLTLMRPLIWTERDLVSRGLSTLAVLPRHRAGLSDSQELIGFLRVQVLNVLQNHDRPVLMVAGVAGGEGASTLCARLALSLAHSGQRVLVVNADQKRGIQHPLEVKGGADQPWRQMTEPGGARDMQSVVSETPALQIKEVGLRVHLLAASGTPGSTDRADLPAGGPEISTLVDMAGQSGLGEMLRCWGQGHDLILVDSPPLLVCSDGLRLGQHTDGILIVIEAGRTSLYELDQTLRYAAAVGLPVLGFVLNKAPAVARRSRFKHDGIRTGEAR
ncbi:nucleotide-binding protein [Deinococcus aerophilus]|uniref:nucleotide-binding protein n=1 Tax=Deinococcus aerophilus TaxID=522488 RepID=UPI00166CC2FD|nr:cellulose synthase operon protein YhjQ/BcsQ [Deinococcus aerophilus]